MNNSTPSFEYKKGILNSGFSLLFLALVMIPVVLFRHGFLDLTYISLVTFFCGSLVYFAIWNIYKIQFIGNTTEYTNVFGKKSIIPNDKIFYSETYFIREKSYFNKDKQTLKLEIKFPRNRIILYKDEDPNYDLIINFCKEHYSKFYVDSFDYKSLIIPVILGGIGIYLFTFTQECTKQKNLDDLSEIKKFGYVKITGTYKDYETIGKGNTNIWFHLYEFPKFDFSPIDFSEDKSRYYNLNSSGEKVVFYISPNEYKKKIIKTVPLKFYDRYFLYNEIKVYKTE
ncbi:hypothetical protein [Soonwooa sp.]|uniref:hypothetical protein n=1 Tax=Soonwooa sp. TaxID=1938592 RepID=UPI002628CD91|nr:hypothetical protein [Soonwooa sp.]